MSLVFVQADQPFYLLGDASNMDIFALLSSGIENTMILSEVNEGITVET
jgi:hypothetical protein